MPNRLEDIWSNVPFLCGLREPQALHLVRQLKLPR